MLLIFVFILKTDFSIYFYIYTTFGPRVPIIHNPGVNALKFVLGINCLRTRKDGGLIS